MLSKWWLHIQNLSLSERVPEIRIFSICQLIGENPRKCDSTKGVGSADSSVAIDCDGRFSGWKLSLASHIAIKSAEPCDLVDGIIVY